MVQAAPEAATGTPAAEAPIQLTDRDRASIAPHILATLPQETTSPVDGDAPPEDDAAPLTEGTTPTDEGGETPDGGDPETPEVQHAKWVGLLDQNPKGITSIPRAHQPQVVADWKDGLEKAAMGAIRDHGESEYQRGLREAQQATTLQAKVETLDALLEQGDHLAFKEAAAQFPGGERNYHRVKADMAPIAADSPELYQRKGAELVAALQREFPEAVAALGRHPATEAGLEALRNDVANVRARAQLLRQRPDPDQQKLADRTAATEQRKRLPKPDASDATSSSAPPSAAEAKEWTPQQWMAYEQKHGKPAMDALIKGLNG